MAKNISSPTKKVGALEDFLGVQAGAARHPRERAVFVGISQALRRAALPQ